MSVVCMLAALAIAFAPGGASAQHGQPGHVISIDGTSTITGLCQYVWASPLKRDDLGIPKPSSLPPTCRTNPSTGQPVPCALRRNLGAYPQNPNSPQLTPPTTPPPAGWQPEVGINPPCTGKISATSDPISGCVDLATGNTGCRLSAPTWFYGYCGQTYGGAGETTDAGGLYGAGLNYTFDKIGFPRGRGIWEFGGRTTNGKQLRMYLAAAPNKENELVTCDVPGSPAITSITFNGLILIDHPLPARIIRPASEAGWHLCWSDPMVRPIPAGDGC